MGLNYKGHDRYYYPPDAWGARKRAQREINKYLEEKAAKEARMIEVDGQWIDPLDPDGELARKEARSLKWQAAIFYIIIGTVVLAAAGTVVQWFIEMA